jgi:hypothetical protein
MSDPNPLSSIFYEGSSSSLLGNNSANSNFLYSGTYNGKDFYVPPSDPDPTKTDSQPYRFCVFTPETYPAFGNTDTSIRTQISTIYDINLPLVRSENSVRSNSNFPNVAKWGSGNSLLGTTTNTKSFAFKKVNTVIVNGQPTSRIENFYLTLAGSLSVPNASVSQDTWYIFPKLFTSSNNGNVPTTNSTPSNNNVPFTKFISITSPFLTTTSGSIYNSTTKPTTQTISIENRNTINVNVDLKMYLCATANNASTIDNNPYGVRVTIRDSKLKPTLSTNTNNSNNKVYCIDNTQTSSVTLPGLLDKQLLPSSEIKPSTITLTPNQCMDITLMKIIASPTGVGSNDSSVLFIDLDSLLFTTPDLRLSSDKSSYYYGNKSTMNVSCTLIPNNINKDGIAGEELSLRITKLNTTSNNYEDYDLFSATVASSNIAIFDINSRINKDYPSGSYKAIVSYDSSRVNRTLLPDTPSHYYNGTSNEISFNILRKPIEIVYDSTKLITNTSTLSNNYSILREASFSDFLIYDTSDSSNRRLLNNFQGGIVFTVKDSTDVTVYTETFSNKTNFNDLRFIPKDNGFNIASLYKFNITFTPNDIEIIPFTTSYYTFNTESPILSHNLYNSSDELKNEITLSYLSTATIECVLKDSKGNIYESSVVSGVSRSNFYKNNDFPSRNIDLTLEYDSSSKTYKNTFSPKSLNLLRYNLTSFDILSSFVLKFNNVTLLTSTNKTIKFNGVELILSIDKQTPNVYDSVTLNSYIKDKTNNDVYAIADIDGKIIYTIKQGSKSFKVQEVETQNANSIFEYSFVPNALLITKTNDSPISVNSVFEFKDTLVSQLTSSNEFNIQLIAPSISITPKSEINDYHYGQEFSVVLGGISGKNDLGTLFLYGKAISPNNLLEVAKIENASLNTTHKFQNIDIDDLVEDDVLSNLQLNQVVNGLVKWVPNSIDKYQNVQDTFQVTLSKTETRFSNVTIVNNNCVFTQTIKVTGSIVSDYTEVIHGRVELYNKNDETTIVSQDVLTNLNAFELSVTSTVVKSFNFILKFVPTYDKVYQNASYDNESNLIIFKKVTVEPTIVVKDLSSNTDLSSNNVNMNYTHNFKIEVSNMNELNGTNVILSIGSDYTSNELTINDGKILSREINFFNLNKTLSTSIDISGLKNISLNFVGYNASSSLQSLYTISSPNKNIQFIKDLVVPKINTITFINQFTNQPVTNSPISLNFEQLYDIKGNFDLIKDINNNVIPVAGVLKLFIGDTDSTPIILNSTLILSNIEQVIVKDFKSSDYEITSGNKTFIFQFVPTDSNINTILSSSLNCKITTATIDSITSLKFFPRNSQKFSYFGENFNGTIKIFNIGAYGTLEIYCKNPSDENDLQKLSTIILDEDEVNKTRGETITFDFVCVPILFDCPNLVTTYDIIVKYESGNTSKYSSNEIGQVFHYNISQLSVHLTELTIDDINFDKFEIDVNGYNRKMIGDILKVKGKIYTQNNEPVKQGRIQLKLYLSPEELENLSLLTANMSLVDSEYDTNDNSYYVNVNEKGEFTCNHLILSDSVFFGIPGTYFQVYYNNNKNYLPKYFEFEEVTGIFALYVSNKKLSSQNVKFQLNSSSLTNSYNFSYQEDILHFYIEINELFSSVTNPILRLRLFDIKSNSSIGIGNNGKAGTYELEIKELIKTVNNVSKTICYAEIFLNPKTENISKVLNSNYSASISFDAYGFDTYTADLNDVNNNDLFFNIEPTIPVIDLEFKSTDTNAVISSIDYEQSVNIIVKVKTLYEIQSHASQSRNILGSVVLRNQGESNNENGKIMNILENENLNNSIVFNSVDVTNGSFSAGKIVKYSPKNNSEDLIIDIKKIFALFTPNYENVQNKYTNAKFSKLFSIIKYTPTLVIKSINPIDVITHSVPVNKIDNQNVYYDDVLNVKYNGFINFDEQFSVECELDKNLSGTLEYYYSSTNDNNNNFTKIEPIATVNTGKNGGIDEENKLITATFNQKLLQIPQNHLYYLKAIFNPTIMHPITQDSYFYNPDESPVLYFNIFQSNKFGVGKIFWDKNDNTVISKTKSFTANQTIKIFFSFEFDSSVNIEEKRCEVTFFHTSFEDNSNRFYQPVYLDLTNKETNIITNYFEVPATTFLYNSEPYSIRALFKPVLSNNTKNKNYPIVVERNPLTLIIKPFISITTNKPNFTYQYSDSVSLNVTLNSGSGITDISPYNKLVFEISNYNDSTVTYNSITEHTFTGVLVEFPNFQDIINKDSTDTVHLRPGTYSLSIYANNSTNNDNYKTEVLTTTFTITKKSVIPSLTFDKYNLTYRSAIQLLLNIGNFPLEVGKTQITFTNVETSVETNKNILSTDLIEDEELPLHYSYDVSDISSWLNSGLYKISAVLDNTYYQGSQVDNADYRLLVHKETSTMIQLSQNIYSVKYGEDLPLTASVKFGENNITSGQLLLKINNGDERTIERDFNIPSNSLNKDINNLVLYFKDNNYISKSLPFQVNVTKKLTSDLIVPSLSFNENENTENVFNLHLSNYNESDIVSFYKLSSLSKIVPTISSFSASTSSGLYTFNFTDLSYGDNQIYAIVRSSTYDIKSTSVNVIRSKYNSTIALDSTTFAENYSANSLVNIKYKVTKTSDVNQVISNNGMVEFHKVVYENDGTTVNHDEIIGYVTINNNVAQISEYKLVANSKVNNDGLYFDNKIKFYARFINSIDFSDSVSAYSSLISIQTKSASRIIDDTILAETYKLGDTVSLEYIVTKGFSSYTSTTDNTNVKAKVNAEQQAIVDVENANINLTIKNNLFVSATNAYNEAVRIFNLKSSELDTATNNKNTAYGTLQTAKQSLETAKQTLDAVTIDKEKAELAFKTIQEVSKLMNMSFPLENASNSIASSESAYNIAKSAYDSKLLEYNGILAEISTNETNLNNMNNLLDIAQLAYDNALIEVNSKESLLNSAQSIYESAFIQHASDLDAVNSKQSEIITLKEHIESIEDEYDSKKELYESELVIYNEKNSLFLSQEPTLLSNRNTAQINYNNANLDYNTNYVSYSQILTTKTSELNTANANYSAKQALLQAENDKAYALGELSNIWMLIDQQSDNETAQNPFIIVYTLIDNVTANAKSWYKSKLFYGSNIGANVKGAMLLYTGEVDPGVHLDVQNRVKLDFNESLSEGLKDLSEVVLAVSVHTSSNTSSTLLNDYNFTFKELGTIGTTANATNSFIPNSGNNTIEIYGNGGIPGTIVEGVDGWGFNNNTLKSNGELPKINWYVLSNKSQGYIMQLNLALTTKNNAQTAFDSANSNVNTLLDNKNNTYAILEIAKNTYEDAEKIVDDAYVILQAKLTNFTPFKTDYENSVSQLETKETQLVSLKNIEANSESIVQDNKVLVDTASANLALVKTVLETRLNSFNTAKTNYNTANTSLNTSKNKLTLVTNGKTIVQLVSSLLSDKNNKYVIWQTYDQYVKLLQSNSELSMKNILIEMTNEISSDFDNKFNLWNIQLNNVSSKQSLYDISLSNYNTAINNKNEANNNKNTALSNKNSAENNYNIANTNYLNSVSTKNVCINNARAVLDSIALTHGYVIIYKEITKENGLPMTQILGQLKPNERGLVILPYKFVETGAVKFYAKLTDLPDYYDSQSSHIHTSVFERNDTLIYNNSNLNSELYRVGDTVTLNYSVVKTNPTETPVTEGFIAVYKKVSTNVQLLDYYEVNEVNNGVISHNHKLIDSGSVSFYAKYIYSVNNDDEIGLTQTINVVSKLNSSIEDISLESESYKLGNSIDIKYKLTSTNIFTVNGLPNSRTENIGEGVVEVHKVVNNLDEVIGYLQLANDSNGIVSMNYDLVDVGTVKFYARYMGTKNYHPADNNIVDDIREITVVDKYIVDVNNISEITNPVSKKLGDSVVLKYNVSYNSQPVNEGIFEISKTFEKNNTTFSEILGYATINNGEAIFTHKLVDVDCEIHLTGKYINSINYKEEPSNSNLSNVVNVFSKYNSNISRTSSIKGSDENYKLGDLLILEYTITNDDDVIINNLDGIIYIHKVVKISETIEKDEIIYYAVPNVTSGKVSYTHKIETLESTSFYGEFKESANYDDSKSSIKEINVIQEYTSASNTLTINNSSPSFGNSVTLTSTLEDGSKIINEGSIEFYVLINSVQQLIGITSVSNSSASLNYNVNDMGSIKFKSIYKNSSNYVDVISNEVTATVSKNNIDSLVLPTISGMEFDIVNIEATINYGKELCYQNPGIIEFTITNNGQSSITNVDIINNKAVYKLYLANTLAYEVKAQFKGNDLFNESTIVTKTFTPTAYNNYNTTLTITETSITTNYCKVEATLSLINNTVDEKFLSLNTGYVVFESYLNNVIDNSKTVIIPLVDGKAECKVRKDSNYSYAVKFVDKTTSPNITIPNPVTNP